MTLNKRKQEPDTMTPLIFLKKLKGAATNHSAIKHLLDILGFILMAALFVTFFFFLDYKAISEGISHYGVSWLRFTTTVSPLSPPSFAPIQSETTTTTTTPPPEVEKAGSSLRKGFLDKGSDGCDVFDGNWVWDDSYPLYRSSDCPFMDGGFRCSENGRPDSSYTMWRWQPNDCDLPRFNATTILEKLRNRRVAFVGDSIGRNQWESFLCMLASAVPNKTSIYEMQGNPITKHQGSLVFMFKDYNCRVEYYRSPYLVYQGSAPRGAPKGVRMTIRVDTLDWGFRKLKGADLLVFNSGHWWTKDKTLKMGCYFQEGAEVKMGMSIETAFQRSMETLVDFVNRHQEKKKKKTHIFFRTYAPVHFRGGSWRGGGTCDSLKLPDLGEMRHTADRHVEIVSNVVSKHSNNKSQAMNLLDVTMMTSQRKDGHVSLYARSRGRNQTQSRYQDCSHWCLPGVPDTWNELLIALFLKQESVS